MFYCDGDAALPRILQMPQPIQRGTRHSLSESYYMGEKLIKMGLSVV